MLTGCFADLDSLLDVRPFGSALDVAALASRREYLNLDKWLSDHPNAHREAFTRAVLDFLDVKVNSELAQQDPSVEQRTTPLNPQTNHFYPNASYLVGFFYRYVLSNLVEPGAESVFFIARCHPQTQSISPTSAI
jgi:CCR4-NOT transcription complex subunit 1 HEAT repeat